MPGGRRLNFCIGEADDSFWIGDRMEKIARSAENEWHIGIMIVVKVSLQCKV